MSKMDVGEEIYLLMCVTRASKESVPGAAFVTAEAARAYVDSNSALLAEFGEWSVKAVTVFG